MTVTFDNEEFVREIIYHANKDHELGCPRRGTFGNRCDCRYDMRTDDLMMEAAARIKALEQKVDGLEMQLEELRKAEYDKDWV